MKVYGEAQVAALQISAKDCAPSNAADVAAPRKECAVTLVGACLFTALYAISIASFNQEASALEDTLLPFL